MKVNRPLLNTLPLLLVLVAALFASSSTAATSVPVSDPNWFWSDLNWYHTPSNKVAQSNNPGAYFKFGFTGTSLSIELAPTPANPSTAYMTLRFSVDDKPYQDFVISGSTLSINLAQNLNSQANHTVIGFIKNSLQSQDRWNGPACSVVISSATLDTGARTIPPTVLSKRILVYWDSIGEGVRTLGSGGTDLTDNDSTITWAFALAAALQAEISVVAFGAQGYTVFGQGRVVPLLTPGSPLETAWDKYFVNTTRLNSSGHFLIEPDYIFCGHGTNDRGANPTMVASSALAWLGAVRAAAPKANIFLVVPFGGFNAQPIQDAFTKYMSASNDSAAHFVDLGAAGQTGLAGGGASLFASDGIHPLSGRDGQLGAMLASAALNAMLH